MRPSTRPFRSRLRGHFGRRLLRPLAPACFAVAAAVTANELGCRPAPPPHEGQSDSRPPSTGSSGGQADATAMDDPRDARLDGLAREILDASASESGASAPESGAGSAPDPMANHHDTTDELLTLFAVKDFTEQEKKTIQPDAFLRRMFKSDGPMHANQGNKDIARHAISKEQCLEGLKGVVIQTPEQREKCGAENMVPIWVKGKEAWFCIDVFEFPNKACELPMVWTQPPLAKKVCELQGKRLCSDIEWNMACRGDPNGGDDQRYAYGDKLDLEICHTNLRHRQPCVVQNAGTTWKTCTTDTEPSGAYPKCRSRFGVFDQHGNVAEVMMRREADRVVTQLKGSAWFYVELAKEPGQPVPESTTNKTGAYADHCNFDPRWHVETLETAMHVNYHLGFRCCKSIP